jgi:Tetracyclin repressor-like, C-terminal domain
MRHMRPEGNPSDETLWTDVDAIDMHMAIGASCVFRVANRYTFGTIFGRDMLDPALREHYRTMLGDMIVKHLAVRTE